LAFAGFAHPLGARVLSLGHVATRFCVHGNEWVEKWQMPYVSEVMANVMANVASLYTPATNSSASKTHIASALTGGIGVALATEAQRLKGQLVRIFKVCLPTLDAALLPMSATLWQGVLIVFGEASHDPSHDTFTTDRSSLD